MVSMEVSIQMEPIVTSLVYIVLIVLVLKFLPKPPDTESLREKVTSQGVIIQDLQDKYLETLEALAIANRLILEKSEYINNLRQRVSELEQQLGIPKKKMKVLGIWPEPKIEIASHIEEVAIYNAGFDYTALRKEEATKEGIINELYRDKYDILEIGAHGDDRGILLFQDIAVPGWWFRVLKEIPSIQLVILLACTSDSVGDILVKAGIPFVISMQRNVEDTDAVRFIELFYERISVIGELKEQNITKAVETAKLVLTHSVSSGIRLRKGKIEE